MKLFPNIKKKYVRHLMLKSFGTWIGSTVTILGIVDCIDFLSGLTGAAFLVAVNPANFFGVGLILGFAVLAGLVIGAVAYYGFHHKLMSKIAKKWQENLKDEIHNLPVYHRELHKTLDNPKILKRSDVAKRYRMDGLEGGRLKRTEHMPNEVDPNMIMIKGPYDEPAAKFQLNWNKHTFMPSTVNAEGKTIELGFFEEDAVLVAPRHRIDEAAWGKIHAGIKSVKAEKCGTIKSAAKALRFWRSDTNAKAAGKAVTRAAARKLRNRGETYLVDEIVAAGKKYN